MTITAEALRKLAALNLSPEQMAGVLDLLADGLEKEEERKRKQVERTRKSRSMQRDGNVTVTSQQRDTPLNGSNGFLQSSLNSLTPPYSPPKKSPKPSSDPRFAEFWNVYPLKKSKSDAERAFEKAVRFTDFETILAGAKKYAASVAGENPKFTAHAPTWLNGKRWEDDLSQAPPQKSKQIPTRAPHKNELIL